MAPRAIWKGFLKVAELSCPVALYTAATTSDRIAFHTINRETGHRVKRQYVDAETGRIVEADQQMKGYEVAKGQYVELEPEEVAAVVPESDKTLDVGAFISCDEIDDLYFDRPYYIGPSSPVASDAFALLREGMRGKGVAALARAVLFRRVRTVLIRSLDDGMVANTLHFDYEVRSEKEAFEDIPDLTIKGEMLDLAKHIVSTKKGKFDPRSFDDRYESAIADLVRAKQQGKPFKPAAQPAATKVIDLMDALRRSAGAGSSSKSARKAGKQATKQTAARKGTAKSRHAASRRKAS